MKLHSSITLLEKKLNSGDIITVESYHFIYILLKYTRTEIFRADFTGYDIT